MYVCMYVIKITRDRLFHKITHNDEFGVDRTVDKSPGRSIYKAVVKLLESQSCIRCIQ